MPRPAPPYDRRIQMHRCSVVVLLLIFTTTVASAQSPTTAPVGSPLAPASEPALPRVVVARDDFVITQSCIVEIAVGAIISDANDNGVIQVRASGITIEFAAPPMFGEKVGAQPDTFRGIAIRVNGQKNVTIRNASIRGYRCAVWATDADGLRLENVNANDLRRAQLKSTMAAEDQSDWLFPHENDDNTWLNKYGAAFYIENSKDVVVRSCRAQFDQNALILDRVDGAQVFDNDFSFNSGWGIALWRSSGNTICNNAVDFCVRGYSHGVYNRGQDSAGILLFEQCSRNTIANNSATHCGDGLFGFAGKEALGEKAAPAEDFDYKRRGCNDNLIYGNDFSFSAAHGLEITFSFGNVILHNQFRNNGICGIWAGYSQDTLIADNDFSDNGDAGAGAERGGVNIEHGRANKIVSNRFSKNAVGVHLWWDEDATLAKTPWAEANGVDCTENLIGANTFSGDEIAVQLRGTSQTTLAPNRYADVKEELKSDDAAKVTRVESSPEVEMQIPRKVLPGRREVVGARKHLDGRDKIILGEFGPWDHASMFVRPVKRIGAEHVYELYNFAGRSATTLRGEGVAGTATRGTEPIVYTVKANAPGAQPYLVMFGGGGGATGRPPVLVAQCRGTIVDAIWNASIFSWDDSCDPLKDVEKWRARATGPDVRRASLRDLHFPFRNGGPADVPELTAAVKDSGIGKDRFGIIAKCSLELKAGKWELRTRSDDGVRVLVDGKPLIENWSHHGPTVNTAMIDIPADNVVDIVVEYFEIDGFATLDFDVAAINPPAP